MPHKAVALMVAHFVSLTQNLHCHRRRLAFTALTRHASASTVGLPDLPRPVASHLVAHLAALPAPDLLCCSPIASYLARTQARESRKGGETFNTDGISKTTTRTRLLGARMVQCLLVEMGLGEFEAWVQELVAAVS